MEGNSTKRVKVAVLGGGVAGMSAAHELAERGFSVDVYERQPQYVGGKARSVTVPHTGEGGRADLPGEHGFRFFPGFYKHITDTMKRIPFGNNPQGVFNNLVSTQRVLLARFGKPPLPTLVNFPKTKADLETILQDLAHADTGLTKSDIKLFVESLWQILTSSYERRQQMYERQNWWDFMQTNAQRRRDGVAPDAKSSPYEVYCVGGLTRSLVAAQPKLMSVKTGGDILLQLLLLMADPTAHTDRILNGPTNDVWLNPWLTHLTDTLGVRYHKHCYVTRLVCDPDAQRISAAYVRADVGSPEKRIETDYFVAAVPVERMAELVNEEMVAVDATLKYIKVLASPESNALNWMNGIQFYLNQDVPLAPGHVICLDSPWAVTCISQAQFWPQHPLSGYGDGEVKGLLSVDVSNWFEPGLHGKQACECTLEEIVEDVWEQLKKSFVQANGQLLLTDDMRIGFHVDTDIGFNTEHPVLEPVEADGQHQPARTSTAPTSALRTLQPVHNTFATDHNSEPLLVNTANSWSLRPNSFCGIKNLFLASDYVRTNTDLATMEGANEAARRAVNGIIAASGSNAPYCKIWQLHEPNVLAVLRWRDRRRFAKGLPWSDALSWPERILHEANYLLHKVMPKS